MTKKAKHILLIVPTGKHVGLKNVAQALVQAFKEKHVNAINVSAIKQVNTFLSKLTSDDIDAFLEALLEQCYTHTEKADVVIIEGISCDESHPYLERLNKDIAQMLGAKLLFLTNGRINNASLLFMIHSFKAFKNQWLGCILNQMSDILPKAEVQQLEAILQTNNLPLLSNVPVLEGKKSQTSLIDEYAKHLCSEKPLWLDDFIRAPVKPVLSPIIFRYQLVKRAIAANKHILLPEGEEPRTICAANICAEKNIAKLTLLGDKTKIHAVAKKQNIVLHKNINIINPSDITERYIDLLVKLRQQKGMTHALAEKALQDHIMLGTLMLYNGDIDGLVSGAIHSTANTVRPALQIIKTKPHIKLVSSVFFMCLPEVSIYADCAVNPNPSAEDLADIAIESAETAKTFGISPRIAMISYSSGTSAQGVDIERVKNAVSYVKEKQPDLLIDGPLQYDAASIQDVAKQKVPKSPLAGAANVFIFPDLNTGNTTYKAVQRNAHIISIGPILQGLRKPVNDLSRGSSIQDIVYTIAVTAVQATVTF
jgi:phosphate acetyltransferase